MNLAEEKETKNDQRKSNRTNPDICLWAREEISFMDERFHHARWLGAACAVKSSSSAPLLMTYITR